MTDKPKILYHGSPNKITDRYIRKKEAHINSMQTPITAAFATPSYGHARLYAAMEIISRGWMSPRSNDTLYVEKVTSNIANRKAYVYEVSSDGFIPDGNDYYCLNDVPILKTNEIDVMQEIKKGNIKVYVLQDIVNFDGLSDKERLALWRQTCKTGNFKRYLPEESNQIATFLSKGPDR